MSIKNDQQKKTPVLLVNKSGNKIQIGLPVLCSYGSDDDEEEEEQAPKSTLKNLNPPDKSLSKEKPRSGLFAMLPPPKTAQNPFIKKQPALTPKPESTLLPRTLKTVNSEIKQQDSSNSTSKFGSYKDYEVQDPDPFFNEQDEPIEPTEPTQVVEQIKVIAEQTVFDQEALIALCGSHGKKSKLDSIQITDVRANDIVGNNKAELMKQITSDYRPPSNKDYFGSGSRRTHQITYLAKVAVERDQELKNEWAQNKFNKTQAKRKYGF